MAERLVALGIPREQAGVRSELAGLALGYDPWDLGLQVHQDTVDPQLDKLGVDYDPSAKFTGKNGIDLGKPEPPSFLKFYQNE